jgi:endonuclease-3
MVSPFPIDDTLTRLQKAAVNFEIPVVSEVAGMEGDPFKVLLATIISLRTKDEVTGPASARLFALGGDPEHLLAVAEEHIAKAIYPAGFFRVKAKTIHKICRRLLDDFGGQVPNTLEALLSLDGVGRKTANLTLTEGFNLPGICVDIHVHRICNRWGYIRCKTPDQTEMRLRAKLAQEWWIPINQILVAFGRNICRPVSPHCSICPMADVCRQVGVTTTR